MAPSASVAETAGGVPELSETRWKPQFPPRARAHRAMSVVPGRPDLAAVSGGEQPNRDAVAIARGTHGALDQQIGAELPADVADVRLHALEPKLDVRATTRKPSVRPGDQSILRPNHRRSTRLHCPL